MKDKLYQIDTGYACGGIIIKDGVVAQAAPIFKWMIGKTFKSVRRWRKIHSIIEVS